MIIAQGSVSIDENAKLANEASQHSDDNKRQMESLLGGKITQSTLDPRTFDTGTHQEGDMWIQIDSTSDGKQLPTAKAMFYYTNGAWVPKKWDSQSLAVKQLSALTADLGTINNGTINSVAMNGVEINVDFDGYGTGSYDGGHNSLSWSTDGMFQPDNGPTFVDDAYLGFHFKHGLMSWKARRTGGSTSDGINTYDSTYIGPNDIKVRNTNSVSAADMTSRVDIRSNYIEVASNWISGSQPGYKGVLLGADGSGKFTNGIDSGGDITIWGEFQFIGQYIKAPSGHLKVGSGIETDYSITAGGDIQTKYGSVKAQGVTLKSDLSKKNVKKQFSPKSALSEVLGTDIYQYEYKGNHDTVNIGPVIDDVHDIDKSQYSTSEYMVTHSDDGNYLALQNSIGLLIGSVHELSNQNEKLLARITQLEMKQNGNNK